MPRLIKDGEIVEDTWLPIDPESNAFAANQVLTLTQWRQPGDRVGSAVQVEPGDDYSVLYDRLEALSLVVVHFPVFTDGRGFSCARDLRERGYGGELRASGRFLRDQMTYLARVGFNAFQMADESLLEEALGSLRDFSEHYQASIDQPQPLFRRRS